MARVVKLNVVGALRADNEFGAALQPQHEADRADARRLMPTVGQPSRPGSTFSADSTINQLAIGGPR